MRTNGRITCYQVHLRDGRQLNLRYVLENFEQLGEEVRARLGVR
jgi:hypothetical protein